MIGGIVTFLVLAAFGLRWRIVIVALVCGAAVNLALLHHWHDGWTSWVLF